MKLIIDISDDFYNVLTDSQYDKIRNIELEHLDLVQKIKNGISLEKELEMIKEKIQEFAYYDSNYCGFVLPEWKVSDIIYEYIRELKGE